MPVQIGKENVGILAAAAVVLSAAFWGLFWVPVRYFETNGIGGEWAVVLLYLPACIILLPLFAYDWRKQVEHFRLALYVGILVGIGISCYSLSLLYTTVVRATLLFYLTPIWSTILAFFLLRESMQWNRWAAIILGILGMFFLVSTNETRGVNFGDLLAFLSGVLWAAGATVIRANNEMPILGMTFFQFLFAIVFILVFTAFIGPFSFPDVSVSLSLFFVVALASIFMMIPSIFLLVWASQLLSPGRVGLLMMSEIIVAVGTASYFLPDETLTALQWLGAGMILSAAIVEFSPAS